MKTLTNKEEEIMNHYWNRGDMQIRELQSCYDDPKPHVNTLSTLVHILEEKGFLSHRALSARCFQYFATVSREEYSRGSLKTSSVSSSAIRISTLCRRLLRRKTSPWMT